MPNGDKTGPEGKGPQTGRGLGVGLGAGSGQGRGLGAGAGAGRGAGRGRAVASGGRMGGPVATGPGGICKCLKCGHEEPQVRGQPCMNKKCPQCGNLMARK